MLHFDAIARMDRRHAVVLAVVLLIAGWGLPVLGWGAEGHHVIARLAWNQMTPEARRFAQDLLGAEDFVAASTWAEDVRSSRPETYNWHFVNIPYSEQTYTPSRDCPPSPRGDCVVAELERARRDVSDGSLPRERRAEALKFLIHLVGDVHQPLHAIDNHDRGGNDIPVSVAGQPADRAPLNLHAAWDSRLMSLRGLAETAYADTLMQDVRTQRIAALPIDFAKWAESTHQIAVEYAYDYPGFSPAGPPATPIMLSADYQRRAGLAIDHQLELAGVRLAAVLNQAAGRAK
jgi:hypothetical protein